MNRKLCIIIQRYGLEVLGGAESYARAYAEKLSETNEVTVLTSTAADYTEWKNYYAEGETYLNGVRIIRFSVKKQRDSRLFEQLSSKIFGEIYPSIELCEKWIEEQGPYCPNLLKYLTENKDSYDRFIFMTYLYYPTVMGIEAVKEKAVLVPFLHNEPPLKLPIFDKIFESARGIIFNTPEEEKLAKRRFHITGKPSIITGIGIDIPNAGKAVFPSPDFKIPKRYILYMGRIDSAKGADRLFEYFLDYKKRTGSDLKLVLIGQEIIKIPKNESIVSLGFVSEEKKHALLSKCLCFVLPSHFESLSIAMLEAMAFKKPVLLSAHCDVLKGHCLRSNAGLYFYCREDFFEALKILDENPSLCEALGNNGYLYVLKNYQWSTILDKFFVMLDDKM